MEPLTVICWKWHQPGYRSAFPSATVNVLRAMVARHYPWPHRFICVTDDPAGLASDIEVLPDAHDFAELTSPHGRAGKWPACYRRLRLFHPDAARWFGPRFVSVDLDCVIVGDLTALWHRPEPFVIWRGSAPATPYNGSMLLLAAGARARVWTEFDPARSPAAARSHGYIGSDQAWISHCLGPHEATWGPSDGALTFRRDLRSRAKQLPTRARIVAFPGGLNPWSPAAQRLPWVRQAWHHDGHRPVVVDPGPAPAPATLPPPWPTGEPPRLEACYFCSVTDRQWPRLAQVLETTARAQCPGWTIHIHRFGPNEVSRTLRGSLGANTMKLDYWCQRVQEAPDGARLALIDVDVLIVQSLTPVWDLEFDLAYTARHQSRFPFNAGVIFLRVSPATRAFLVAWRDENRRMFTDPAHHQTWRRQYGGINQASLGCVLASPIAATLHVRPLQCVEWNCEDSTWPSFDPTRTRVLHLKSALRRAVFGLGFVQDPQIRNLAKLWRRTERQLMTPATSPTPAPAR